MAIIGRIRKHSGLAVIIIGVAIAAFVIGDFSGSKNPNRANEIGNIGGEAIPYPEYSNKIEDAITSQKENSGTDKISDEETYSIRTNTWNTMVKEIIMKQELENLGITVTSEELFDQIQGKNPHRYILQYFKDPNTGMYDQALVQNYLRNLEQMEPKAKNQWLRFEQAIKEDRLDSKFNILIAKAYYVPKAFSKRYSEDQNTKLMLRSISPAIASISDSAVKITDADYQSYYDNNKHFFYQDEATRDADYVVFAVSPSEADQKKISDDVEKLYADFQQVQDVRNFVNANSDNKFDSTFKKKGTLPGNLDSVSFKTSIGGFVPPFQFNNNWYMSKILKFQDRPDTIRGNQILISFANSPLENPNIKRTREQAKLTADSLLVVVKKTPLQFKEFAFKHSDYPTVKEDGGKLNDVIDGEPTFSIFFNKALEMKVNDFTIIETGLGYSIFQLTYKGKVFPKLQAAVIQRAIEPSNKTFQDTYLKASAFAGQNKTSDAFEKAAIAQKLEKRSTMGMKEMDNFIMGMPSAREVVRWCYKEETKVGDISPVFDLNGKYIVAVLKSITDKGVVPLDKIKDRIEMAVSNEKKIDMLSKQLEEAVKTNKDINTLAAQFGVKVDTSMLTFSGFNQSALGRENEIIGTLFTKAKGSFNAPLRGKYGVYAVVVDDILPATVKEDYTPEAAQMSSAFSNRVPGSLFEAMKKTVEIKDNRTIFY